MVLPHPDRVALNRDRAGADPIGMRLSTAAPDVATPRVMGRTAGLLYTCGGLAAGVAAAGPGGPGHGAAVLWGLAAVALLAGGYLLLAGHRLPRGAFHVVVLAGTVLLSAGVVVSPSAYVALALAPLYTFIAIDCFFFFAWPQATAHLATMLAAQTVALTSHPSLGPAVAASTGLASVAVSLVVGRLVQRASSASRDGLTGLLNRRGFDDALETAVAAADRSGQPLAVALLDLDRFKQLNDRHGHAGGDSVLREVAELLTGSVRAGDLVARLGGDELAVLLPGADCARAAELAERLRCAVARLRPPGFDAGEVSVSLGVAAVAGDDAFPVEITSRADAQLYRAKITRNAVGVDGVDTWPAAWPASRPGEGRERRLADDGVPGSVPGKDQPVPAVRRSDGGL